MTRRCLLTAPSICLTGCAARPLSYLDADAPIAGRLAQLGWGLLIISVVVVIVVGGLLAGAILRRRRGADTDRLAVRRDAGGMRWIYIGVSVSTVALIASAIWTLLTLRAVAQPGGGVTPLAISVTGHQWWWEATYPGAEPDGTFRTASEIHIPTNVPVKLELRADDVIHSFWVPKLAGKTDVIPGHANSMWIEARTPGVYRGQCMEYCGVEHALMAFRVVAEPPGQFAAWRRRQLAGASTGASIAPGYRVFARRCSACHAIRGTESGGIYGPDLTNLSGRATLASGTLPNTPANLARWIAHPQAVKPGARMPDIDLPPGEMQPLVAYLESR